MLWKFIQVFLLFTEAQLDYLEDYLKTIFPFLKKVQNNARSFRGYQNTHKWAFTIAINCIGMQRGVQFRQFNFLKKPF